MCPTCLHSEKRRADDCTIQTYCKAQDKFDFRGGQCPEYMDRQCTLCKHESGNDERCELCIGLIGKPYFELKVVE